MTRKIIRQVPKYLPPSIIFLDELKEIESLVLSSMGDGYTPDGFLYEINEECTVDSIDELKAYGGHVKVFKMTAVYRRNILDSIEVGRSEIFALERYHPAYITLPLCLKIDEQSFYYQLKEIFEARRRPLRAIVEALPDGLRIALGMIVLPLFVGVILGWITTDIVMPLRQGQTHATLHATFGGVIAVFLLLVIFLFWKWIWPISSQYRVNFYYARDMQLEREKNRRAQLEKIGLALLGTLLGVLGTLFVKWMGQGTKH